MQAASDPAYIELKQKFAQIDSDHDGFINKQQLQAFMNSQKLFHIQSWKTNEVMSECENKMNEQDFTIWIMGCKMGLQDLAQVKFKFFNNLKNLKSAGPSDHIGTKRSNLNISVNKEEQSKAPSEQHYFNLKFGVDKEADTKKRQQVSKVLGRNPSDIYFLVKFRAIAQGQKIAQQLNELVQMGVTLASELGPTVTAIVQSLTITTKWANDFIYLVLQLNNSFINMLLKFLNEAIQQLSLQGKCFLNTRISSDFSKVLSNTFNPLSQSVGLNADLEIGGTCLSILKEKLIQGFENVNSDEKANYIFMFLLEQVNLDLSFASLKECFESFGFNEESIPKPAVMAGEIKNYQIKEIISQFLPEGDSILTTVSDYCKPEGQISLNISNLAVQLLFNFNIQKAFDLL